MEMQALTQDEAKKRALDWFESKGWEAFPFQQSTWNAYWQGKSGLLNAPTGSGKTYALWIPAVLDSLINPDEYRAKGQLYVLWVTPLRALAKDINAAMQQFCIENEIDWEVGLRTGDTTSADRQKQKKSKPQALVITPESIHILLSQSDYEYFFKNLKCIIVDEWHELIGTKRGVATELAISRIKTIANQSASIQHETIQVGETSIDSDQSHPLQSIATQSNTVRKRTGSSLRVWGVSATIGNLGQAKRVLLGEDLHKDGVAIRSDIQKEIEVTSVLPDEVEKFPWSGHLGTNLLPKILPIINQSSSTLLFTNTRSQTELWYQALLKYAPDLAGTIAMHHGSMDHDLRNWVEDALHDGKLKCVVCTSSLDLGVDFRPVDTVIQVGGPKGVSRFQQRAGRSGHRPGATSKIFFVPTHSLELIEGVALREAIRDEKFESRKPLEKCMDVLVQYLVTLAVSSGFKPLQILQEVKNTYAFRLLAGEEWNWALDFITTGGKTLGAYDEFARVYQEDGIYKIINRRAATRHKLSIGTIVGDPALKVRMVKGGYLGTIEESFVSKLNPGTTFWFAGRNLEFVNIKELTVMVRPSKRKSGLTPAWGGGRLPLSSMLSDMIKSKLSEAQKGHYVGVEMETIRPILELQANWSKIPTDDILLIERTQTKYGNHVFIYPFEGMLVHEVLAGLIAYRISKMTRISFSISMNDYGFELLSEKEVPIEEALELDLFSEENLWEDISESLNKTEMAKRKFRDVATIAGLIFQGYPGKNIRAKHLQASSSILYDVFDEYDKENLLIKQSLDEVMSLQLEQSRLMEAIRRINQMEIQLVDTARPTPFAFPILVDSLRRESLSSEQLSDRVENMVLQLERYASSK